MHQKHLLRFIKSKLRKEPDEVVIFRDGKWMTLKEVFESLHMTGYDLNVDTLDMHADKNTFHRCVCGGGGGAGGDAGYEIGGLLWGGGGGLLGQGMGHLSIWASQEAGACGHNTHRLQHGCSPLRG